ncbi:MAG: hypothetical protein AAFY15_11945, partial [Cyanobacteria bacterium J06648_11]
ARVTRRSVPISPNDIINPIAEARLIGLIALAMFAEYGVRARKYLREHAWQRQRDRKAGYARC